ncbi:Tetraspanin 39D [Carabus blaptoides fortunei]
MVSLGMTCVKYLLFCFNLIFAVSGIVIITVGSIGLYYSDHYSEFVDGSYKSVPIFLIIVGVIVFVVAFFGCCGAVLEKHCMIITFAVFLLVIFTLELAVGIAGYVRRSEVADMLENNFNASLAEYKTNPELRTSWNTVQNDFKCCGIKGPSDWKAVYNSDELPYTCCENNSKDDKCTTSSKNVFKNGCLPSLKEVLQSKAYVIGGVAIGVALIQLIGVVCACCLARSIKKEYETV